MTLVWFMVLVLHGAFWGIISAEGQEEDYKQLPSIKAIQAVLDNYKGACVNPTRHACLINYCTRRYQGPMSRMMPPSLDEFVMISDVQCGMCLAVAKIVNDTFTEVNQMNLSWEQMENLIHSSVCKDKFADFSLRSVGAVRYIGPNMKRSVVKKTVMDGKWQKKLTELCEFYQNFYDSFNLYLRWLHSNESVFQYLCMSGGMFRGCYNVIEPPQFKSCEKDDTLCVFRQVEWNNHKPEPILPPPDVIFDDDFMTTPLDHPHLSKDSNGSPQEIKYLNETIESDELLANPLDKKNI